MLAFLRDARGNTAVLFALTAIPITALVGASIDLSRIHVERMHLQSALDSAVLAAAAMPATASDPDVESEVGSFLNANFNGQGEIVGFEITRSDTSVTAVAYDDMPLLFPSVLGKDEHRIAVRADAERGGVNLEVALVLDITASMGIPGSKISALQSAANALIATILDNQQEGYSSRVALVPYSNSVNVGARANAVRGSTPPARTITGAADWSTGPEQTISGASQTRPVRIRTAADHGFANGDSVYITGVRGMTEINNKAFIVQNADNREFDLYDLTGDRVDGRFYRAYRTGGTPRVQECANARCEARLTSGNHGLQNGDYVHITGLAGPLGAYLNNQTFAVADRTAAEFTLSGSLAPANFSSTGSAWCTTAGCEYFYFTNVSNAPRTFQISDCVTERTGAQAYTDAAPGGAPAGRAYVPSASNCPSAEVAPLTDDKTSLTNQINALRVSGSTAGQIGIAWGWYMLSPNFASLWPSANHAAAYADPETRKVAVIMTDGEFNTGYCNGVISRDSGWDPTYRMWVVPNSERIDCDATNGGTFAQAAQLCTAMKAAGITIYTVAFDVAPNSQAASFMQACASEASLAYLASGGAELEQAFAEIGDSISQLRLTR